MDAKVLEAQKWFNETYADYNWFSELDEDGITGYSTCLALCKALQYEIGLSDIDGIIGPGTLSACPVISSSTTNMNLIKIIQCGFYCKGYECGDISGDYSSETQKAAVKFRADAGFPDTNGSMPPLFVKALLNTDAFILVSKGKSYVRSAQQYLNSYYITKLPNWGLIPCNGIPDRNMMKAIIAALQYEEAGHTTSGVDGIYGNNTLGNAPTLSLGTTKNAYVKIAQMCIMCMMEVNPGLSGNFDVLFKTYVQDFQSFYCLTSATSGVVDSVTWASLLSSKGISTRPALACDTSYKINSLMAKALYDSGYRYIGRYLTGSVGSGASKRDKSLTTSELSTLFNANLNVFAIFQEGAVTLTKFTYEQGRADAAIALEAARLIGVPYGEIIYFAIDYDMTDDNITNYVIPYFKGIRKTINSNYNRYRIGIYGSRNVCTRVASAGYSISSFVSDMSTGFSGNLGYKIPNDWAFDQFYEFPYNDNYGNKIDLDKVAYSGRYNGFAHIQSHGSDDPIPVPTDEILMDRYRELLSIMHVPYSLSLSLEKSFVIDTPVLLTEYSGSYQSDYFLDSDDIGYDLNITNGVIDSFDFSEAQKVIDKMDSTISAEFDKAGGFSLNTTLTNEITKGSVTVGVGSAGGMLKVTYIVREKLWDTPNNTQYFNFKVTFIFRNAPIDENLQKQLALVKDTYIVMCFGLVFILSLPFIVAGVEYLGAIAIQWLAEHFYRLPRP